MMAALFLRQVVRCRSIQFYDALILPPTNHFVSGISPSSTLSHLRNQCRLFASSPQRPAGSSLAFCHSLSYSASLLMWAAATNSRGGGKVRVSCRILVIPPAEPVDMSAFSRPQVVSFSERNDLSAAGAENQRAAGP